MPAAITHEQELILSALADDAENLEQLYKLVCLEWCADPSDPKHPMSGGWRESEQGVSLADLADAVAELVQRGLITVRWENTKIPTGPSEDQSFLWRGWFSLSDAGRSLITG